MNMSKSSDGTKEYTALELRDLGINWLLQQYPDAHVVREFSLAQWGGALIDLAAITPTEIIGIEIKGKGDSPARLKLQGAMYSQVCTRIYLLATPEIQGVIDRNGHRPTGWDMLTMSGGEITNPRARYRDQQPQHWPMNCAGRMLEVLWKNELMRTAKILRVDAVQKDGKASIIRRVADLVPLGKIRPAVIKQLRSRDWGDKQVYKNEVAS
jgi:hypothetical protein